MREPGSDPSLDHTAVVLVVHALIDKYRVRGVDPAVVVDFRNRLDLRGTRHSMVLHQRMV